MTFCIVLRIFGTNICSVDLSFFVLFGVGMSQDGEGVDACYMVKWHLVLLLWEVGVRGDMGGP